MTRAWRISGFRTGSLREHRSKLRAQLFGGLRGGLGSWLRSRRDRFQLRAILFRLGGATGSFTNRRQGGQYLPGVRTGHLLGVAKALERRLQRRLGVGKASAREQQQPIVRRVPRNNL